MTDLFFLVVFLLAACLCMALRIVYLEDRLFNLRLRMKVTSVLVFGKEFEE